MVLRSVRFVSPVFVLAHIVALHVYLAWFDGPGATQALLDVAPDYLAELPPPTTSEPAEVAGRAPTRQGDYQVPTSRPGALDPSKIYPDGEQMLAELGDDWLAELTMRPKLQEQATRILNRGKVPFGAVVVLDVKSGDVLAMADRFDERHAVAPDIDPDGPPHLALRALAPSASVFKIITAAALIESGLAPGRERTFNPARRRVYSKTIEKPGPGAPKSDMFNAFAGSNNGFFSRQADLRLVREDIDLMARRFGFNQVLPFPLLTDASTAHVPRNRLERARMAAGFWHTRLTPLHGAIIAAAVAGDGTVPVPRLVKRLQGPGGHTVDAPERPPVSRAMKASTAKAMRRMMARTVTHGTGRRAFAKWPKALSHISVGGKTGTLAIREPYTAYTWFVGFAPVDNPQVAIAVMVGNGELWWQKGIDIARDVLAAHFRIEAARTVAAR